MGIMLIRCQYDTGFFYFSTVGFPWVCLVQSLLFAILESFAGVAGPGRPTNGAKADRPDKPDRVGRPDRLQS